MAKRILLIVIDNLMRGGAEMLLIGILPQLSQRFRVILVTLSKEVEFDDSEIVCDTRYSLSFSGKRSMITTIKRLKKIIDQHKPDLVHAHLLHSSIVARAACPPRTALVYSLHTIMSKDAFNSSLLNLWLEKFTIKSGQAVIAVSEAVLKDYKEMVPLRGPSFVLKNYVSDEFLDGETHPRQYVSGSIKVVAVGNIKTVKNYGYLIAAFAQMQSLPITLDIYGRDDDGELGHLQTEIDTRKLKISLRGSATNIRELLPAYDFFVSSSIYEGFGIAPVEAMAMGLPLLLSDIPVFREITFNNALFFDLNDPNSFVTLVNNIYQKKYDLELLSRQGIRIAREHYSKQTYLQKLFDIYDQLLPGTRLD